MGYTVAMQDKQTKVGVGVFIFKDGKILMGRRLNSHGADHWSLPGGHLEYGESFEATARREVLEETGLTIDEVRFGAVTNDYFPMEDRHYVSVWMMSDWADGEVTINEPDKYVALDWIDIEHLPAPLFLPWAQLLESEFIDAIRRACAATAESYKT